MVTLFSKWLVSHDGQLTVDDIIEEIMILSLSWGGNRYDKFSKNKDPIRTIQ